MRSDEPVDVRLVPAALAVWAAAGAGIGAGWRSLALAGGAVAVLGALLARVPRSRAAPERPGRGGTTRSPVAGQVLLVAGAVATLLLTTAVQVHARESGGLRVLAEDRARVVLVGTVRSAPRPVGGSTAPDGPAPVRFVLAVRSVEVTGSRTAGPGPPTGTSAAVEVDAPPGAIDLAYGTVVEVPARLSPVPGTTRRAVARARTDSVPAVRHPPPAVLAAADALRSGLVQAATAVPGDGGRLLPAVAVGDTRAVGDLDDAMRVSGLAHLTAVSGAHFTILGALVHAVVARCGVPRRARWLPVVAVLGAFVAVVQPGPSVVRAAVMGAVGVAGVVVGRPARSVPALASAVLVLLLVDPWLATEIGFVLSVVATAGIALLAAPLARRWSARAPGRLAGVPGRLSAWATARSPARSRRPLGRAARVRLVVVLTQALAQALARVTERARDRSGPAGPVATAVAVPVAAQVVCGPVLLVLSPAVPLYAVLANVVAAPAVAPATVGGLLAAVLAPWWPAAAECVAQVAGAACWWLATVARTTAGLPGAQVAWVGGAAGPVLLACASGAALVLVLRCRRDVAP